jgi:hypothetical protein
MKIAVIAAASAMILTSSFALAQNTGTNPPAPSGDAAVSPAAANPVNSGSAGAGRQDLGAGIASGAVNNGTTGDTIGTGHGTSVAPATGLGTTSSATSGKKE